MKVVFPLAVLAVTSLFSFFTASGQSGRVCTKHLSINEATEQNWAPGIVQNNTKTAGGKLYEIKIKVRKSGYITFQNLIIENYVLPVEVVKDGTRNAKGPFRKGDVLTLIARSDKNKEFPGVDDDTTAKLKAKKAVGGISYSFKEKLYLHPLSSFTSAQPKKLTQ